jgi:hypothetical protein
LRLLLLLPRPLLLSPVPVVVVVEVVDAVEVVEVVDVWLRLVVWLVSFLACFCHFSQHTY